MSTTTIIPLVVLFLQLILFAISMFYFGQKVATKDDIRHARDELRNEIRDVRVEMSKMNQNHIDHLAHHNEK